MLAGKSVWRLLQMGPKLCHKRCSWQTSQLQELSACRACGKEKKQRCLTVSGVGGWEDGRVLNSKNDHRRGSHLQGKLMSYLDSLSLTNLEHIQLSRSQKQGCTAQEKGQEVPRGSLKGTVETMKGTTYEPHKLGAHRVHYIRTFLGERFITTCRFHNRIL